MSEHIGRSFTGNLLEEHCPCGNAPCGLVDTALIDAECVQHGPSVNRTLRQLHPADACPAVAP